MEKTYTLELVRKLTRNNKELIRKIVALCMQQLPASVQKLRSSYQLYDFDTLVQELHFIRPVYGYFSLTSLEQECQLINILAAHREHSAELSAALDRLEEETERIITEMKKDQQPAENCYQPVV